VDAVFFKDLTDGWYAITNKKYKVGFGMAWDHSLFKYIWMWQVYGGHYDYPWYGRTYNVAIEPFTSYPGKGIAYAIENETALILNPYQEIETKLVALAYEGNGVKRIAQDGSIDI
jgi:hypothetical protein